MSAGRSADAEDADDLDLASVLVKFNALNSESFGPVGDEPVIGQSSDAKEYDDLMSAIAESVLPTGLRAWRVSSSHHAGRRLVAEQALPKGSVVFQERPLVAAKAELGKVLHAVALELLELLDVEDDDEASPYVQRRAAAARVLQQADLDDRDAAASLDAWAQATFQELFMRDDGLAAPWPRSGAQTLWD